MQLLWEGRNLQNAGQVTFGLRLFTMPWLTSTCRVLYPPAASAVLAQDSRRMGSRQSSHPVCPKPIHPGGKRCATFRCLDWSQVWRSALFHAWVRIICRLGHLTACTSVFTTVQHVPGLSLWHRLLCDEEALSLTKTIKLVGKGMAGMAPAERMHKLQESCNHCRLQVYLSISIACSSPAVQPKEVTPCNPV